MTRENMEYLEFLRTMSALYKSEGNRADGIRNKYDAAACKGRRGAIELSGEKLAAAQLGVRDLWKRQIDHAAKVSAIISQMFIKDKTTGQLAIHPQLLTVGVIGLDIIALKARNILTDYYKSCEEIYQGAVTAIVGEPAVAAVAAVPAAAPASPTNQRIIDAREVAEANLKARQAAAAAAAQPRI